MVGDGNRSSYSVSFEVNILNTRSEEEPIQIKLTVIPKVLYASQTESSKSCKDALCRGHPQYGIITLNYQTPGCQDTF